MPYGMTTPPASRFSYPSTVIGSSSVFSNTFTFPHTPIGQVQTGNFLPCIPGASFGGSLASVTWELLRNGQPEISWVGYTILEDFQAFGGDIITIIGYNIPNGMVTLTWQGYTYNEGSVPLTQPSLSTSGDANIQLANSYQTATRSIAVTAVQTAQSYPFTLVGAPANTATIRVYNTSLSVSVANGTGSPMYYACQTWIGADASATSATTLDRLNLQCLVGTQGNQDQSTNWDGVEYNTATQTLAVYLNTQAGASLLGFGQYMVDATVEYAWF